jgi:hypothetical protein
MDACMYAVSFILEELIISDLYVLACAALWTLKNSSREVSCEFFNCTIALSLTILLVGVYSISKGEQITLRIGSL